MTLITRRSAVAGMAGLASSRALAQTPREPVRLVIANSQWVDALRGRTLWAAVKKYEQAAPHVTLEQQAIPSAEFDNKMTTELSAGLGPDILMMQEILFFALADAGFLADVAPALAGVGNLNATNGNGLVKGKRLGIAWQRAVYALIYNKTLLDAAGAAVPTDVDGLIASARAVTTATPGAIGFAARHLLADFSGWFIDYQNWAYGHGVNYLDAAGKLKVDTDQGVAAFTAFKRMYDARIIPLGDGMPTQRTRFKERRVGFSIDNSGGTLNIASGGPLETRELYAAPLPFRNPGAHQQIFLGVNTRSTKQRAAMDFLAWLVGAEGQQALREASGPDALATDVPVTPEFRAANPWADTFATLAQNSRSGLIPGHEVETGPIMRFVMSALERVLLTNADPRAALVAAQRQIATNF